MPRADAFSWYTRDIMYLGIDIGGTKTLVACMDKHGVIAESQQFATPRAYADFISQLAKVVAFLATKSFTGCCVAVPGRLDRAKGVAVALGNLPWRDVSIQADIQAIAHCPVVIENDANLGGLSEAMLLPQYNRVLYVTISTGIGTGFIVDRAIDPDFADTEGGHMLLEHHGKLQMWEQFASGKAIVRRFGKRAQDITDAATWRVIAHDIALGLIDLIAVIQPEVIVFGGGVDTYFDRFHNHLEAELKKYQTPLTPIPPLRKAARPNEAVVYGCYDLAKRLYGRAD